MWCLHTWVQFSRSAVSDSLRPHGLQHTRPPCPSPTLGVYSNSCPLRRWWMPSKHLILCCPLLLLPSILPSIRVFSMSQLFTSGGQSIGVSISTSVLLVNIQDWSPLGWTDWISLQTKGLSRVFSNTTVQKHQFFSPQLCLQSSSHIHIVEYYFTLKKKKIMTQAITQMNLEEIKWNKTVTKDKYCMILLKGCT